MKKKIAVAILIILAVLAILFICLVFLLVQGLGASIQAAGNEIFGNMVEGVANGLIDGGMEIASDLVSEGVSTILGGLHEPH
ncbi:MAG: hypothetical protein E7523_03580 [Ruminococcaceae bacterium]|nr:hypothetical protein [Oscillospiraceae bacterium]